MPIPATVKCRDGRELGLREVGPAEMLDLIEAAGNAASSDAWMRYAAMICAVNTIDSKPVIMPTTKNAIRDLGRRIGNDGIEALAAVFYPAAAGDDALEDDQSRELEAVKN